MVESIFKYALISIPDPLLREAIIALIGMQTAMSLRPGHLYFPGSNKPHQLMNLKFLYAQGDNSSYLSRKYPKTLSFTLSAALVNS